MGNKEYGKQFSRAFIERISKAFYLTEHAKERIKERSKLWNEDFEKTLNNVGYAIRNCEFAFNDNDGCVVVVLNNDESFICSFSDEIKRWKIITYKETSGNGFTNKDKWFFSQDGVISKKARDRRWKEYRRKMRY